MHTKMADCPQIRAMTLVAAFVVFFYLNLRKREKEKKGKKRRK